MLARSYIAKREKEATARLLRHQEEMAARREELAAWYAGQVAKWEERKRQAEADGKDFTEPMPEPPPGINTNGHVS